MKDYIGMSTDEIADLFSKGCTVNLTGSDLVLIFRSIQYFVEKAPRTEKGLKLERRMLDEVVNPLEDKVLMALKDMRNILIEDLELSRRTENCLHYRNVYTIGQLVNLTEKELWETRNVGKKVMSEIKDKLAELGLSLKVFPDTLEDK